ncbi:PAS domain S-box protein [Oscillatoria acuminata]|uniref:histidine kinase n=1 Tax=Oscillatoria acuminata PCC 6304 TaxID=56110 RepID=K9TM24_9CYAN|nr:PAS domain S-box protein [Oscillatoria acuminata]AFY83902.1 PAS domain S-box [Oscillatoria acuminata PCC 6304]
MSHKNWANPLRQELSREIEEQDQKLNRAKLRWQEIHRPKSNPSSQDAFLRSPDERPSDERSNGLRNPEEWLRLALDVAQMAICEWDIPRDRITGTPGYELLWGRDSGSFNGSFAELLACIHPDDRGAITETLEKAHQGCGNYHVKYRVIWPDRSTHWLESQGKFFYSDGNRPIRAVGTLVNIDQRVSVETQLRQQKRALSALSAGNHIIIHGKKELDVLQQICEMITAIGGYESAWVGYVTEDDPKQIITVAQAGKNLDESLHSGHIIGSESTLASLVPLMRTGIPARGQHPYPETEMTTGRGSLWEGSYTSAIALPLLNEGQLFGTLNLCATQPDAFDPDEVQLLIELTHDLAYGIIALRRQQEHAAAESALRGSEEKLRLALQASNMGTWQWEICRDLLGSDRIRVSCSLECLHLFGINPETFDNSYTTFEACIHPQDRTLVHQTVEEAIETGQPFELEYRVIWGDRTIHWLKARGNAFWDPTGQPLGTIGIVMDITDRKRAELQIQQLLTTERVAHTAAQLAGEQISNILESITDGFIALDTQGQYTYVNQKAAQLLQKRREDLMGQKISTEFPEVTRPQFYQACQQAQEQQTSIYLEEYYPPYDCWFDNYIYPAKDGLSIFFRDTTERKRSQQALQQAKQDLESQVRARTEQLRKANERLENELQHRQRVEQVLQRAYQRLQFHVENTPLAVIEWNREWRILNWSAQAQKIFGWQAEEVFGKSDIDFALIYEADLEAVTQRRNLLISGQQPRTVCCNRNYTKDGRVIDCEWYYSALFAPTGELISVLSLVLDISDRTEALSALHSSEARFRNAFDYATIGMALVAPDGHWLKVNRALCEILGYDEGELLEKTFHDVTHPEDRETDWQSLQDLLGGEIPSYQTEKRYLHRQGQVVWVQLSASLVRDSRERPLYLIAQIQDITARKRAREELHSSRARIAAILELAGEAIISIDSHQRITLFNQAAERIFGYSAAQLLGQPLEKLLPLCLEGTRKSGGNGEGCSTNLARMMDQSGEVMGLRQDGMEFPAEVSISEVEIAEEQVFTLCLRDITDRKRAEAERAKLIEILEATPDFILSARVDGTVFYLNKAARTIFGVPPECPLEPFQIFQSHPGWANDIIQNEGIPTAIAQGTWIGETALVTPQGVEITLSELIIAHKSPDGAVTMFSSIARDITKQKEIEATVRESERRWRRLLETVQLAVVGLDRRGGIEYANPFFLELVGYALSEIQGKDWFELFIPTHQQRRHSEVLEELRTPDFYSHPQSIIVTRSGQEKIIAWNNTVLHDLRGVEMGTLSIGEDITERDAIERMKDEFISVVSHELRTPLASIHGALNLISSGLIEPTGEKGKRVMAIAAESADRLVRLVNDILDLERLTSGKIALVKERHSPRDLIEKAIETMQVMANRAEVNFQVECNPSLELWIDGDRIIQVLTNLLSNAIKFSPTVSTVEISVQGRTLTPNPLGKLDAEPSPSSPSMILFAVKDQGRGIPENKMESIFERFHQVDASDSRKKGGTGLGLAICRSIIQQHGGRIWVESVLNEGSTFYFTLPEITPETSPEEANHEQTNFSH